MNSFGLPRYDAAELTFTITPARTSLGGRQPPNGFSRAQERADDVDANDLVQPLDGEFVEPGLGVQGSGVVDQTTDRADFARCSVEELDDVVLDRHVTLYRNGSGACFGARRDHLVGRLGVCAVVHAHVDATLGREYGRSGPDAATSSGDNQ